jgi:glutathione S-transferase
MYILYGGDFTRATLVQWVLEEGDIEYELRKIDIQNGEHRSADFLAINPAGLVPVLITSDGDALYELAALMLYLADRHQLTELAPPSTDPSIAKLYDLVRSRPSATPFLEGTERTADAYAEMMKKNPGGVIA